MGRKKAPGLRFRSGVWHVDKRIGGRRVCESTGAASFEEAEQFLARLTEEMRQARVYGVRPSRTFEKAAAKFVLENQHKRSIGSDVMRLKQLMPHIGQVSLDKVHRGTLQPYVEARTREGVAAGTINHGLKVARHILNLAAQEWVDENGLTWLAAAPKIKLLPDTQKRQPYPLNWEEQARLFKVLPPHLAAMALFAVNTGCRDGEVCALRWEWEVKVPELGDVRLHRAGEFAEERGRAARRDQPHRWISGRGTAWSASDVRVRLPGTGQSRGCLPTPGNGRA